MEYRYKTSTNVLLGPFVDKSNAASAETALTPSVAISKAGANFAARASTRSVAHYQQGWYKCPANSVDLGTLGRVTFMVAAPNTHLAVFVHGVVLRSGAWDAKYLHPGGSAMVSAAVKKALADQSLDAFSAAASAAAQNALVNNDLDHLLNVAAPAGVPRSNSVMNVVMVSAAAQTFNRTLHSLKAILQRGNEAWGTGSFATQAHVESARANLAAYTATSVQVSAAVKRNLVNYDLDHLVNTSAPAGVPRSNTVMNRVMVSAAGATFTPGTHSLKAIRGAITGGGASAAAVSAAVKNNITNYKLDRLIDASAASTIPVSNSLLDRIMKSSATATFDRTKHSLHGIWNKAGSVSSSGVTPGDYSAIADSVWSRLRSVTATHPSGSYGEAVVLLYGSGAKPVNHDTGGTDNLRLVDTNGAAIAAARIRVYRTSDYNSGLIGLGYVKGQSITNDNGRWVAPCYLDSGVSYTVVFDKGTVMATSSKVIVP